VLHAITEILNEICYVDRRVCLVTDIKRNSKIYAVSLITDE